MGVGGQHHDQAALPPGKDPVPFVQEAGWAQGRSGRMRKISSPQGFDPRTVQPVARRYTDWAIRAHLQLRYEQEMIKRQYKSTSFLSDFNVNWRGKIKINKYSNIKFYENSFKGYRVVAGAHRHMGHT